MAALHNNVETPLRLDTSKLTPRLTTDENLKEFPWSLPSRPAMHPRGSRLAYVETQTFRSSSLRLSTSASDLDAPGQPLATLQQAQEASAECTPPSSEESSDARSRSTSLTEQQLQGFLLQAMDFSTVSLPSSQEDVAQRKQAHDNDPGRVSIPSVDSQPKQLAIASVSPIQAPNAQASLSDLNGRHATLCPPMRLRATTQFASDHITASPYGYDYYMSSEATQEYVKAEHTSSDELIDTSNGPDYSSELHAPIGGPSLPSVLQPPSESPAAEAYRSHWYIGPPTLASTSCMQPKHPAGSIDPKDVGGAPQDLNAGIASGGHSSSIPQPGSWLASSDSSSSPASDEHTRMDASMSQSFSASSHDYTPSPSESRSPEMQPKPNNSTPTQSSSGNKGQGSRLSPTNRVDVACAFCKRRKLRCSGGRPKCSECTDRGHDNCEYAAEIKRRGKSKKTREREARQAELVQARADHAQGLIGDEELERAREAVREAEASTPSSSSSSSKKRKRSAKDTKAPRKSSKASTSG